MSSLIANLLRGSAGLAAQSKGLEVTGNNLTNANTVGYSRQTVQISSGQTFQGAQGLETMATRVDAVTQSRDIFLDRQVISEKSASGGAAATLEIYQEAEDALGQSINTSGGASGVTGTTESASGINSTLSNFFNAVQALASNPSDATARNLVLTQAGTLTDQINSADGKLADVQTQTTEKINSDVTTVNGLLQQVANLNQKIGRYETGGSDQALTLRDQRQSVLEQLSGYLNFKTTPDPSGTGQLTLTATDAIGNSLTLVDKQSVVNPVAFNGAGFFGGTTAVNFTSGSLSAQLKARDGFVQTVRADLANFSTQIRTAVNTAYNPGGSGSDFFAAGTGGKLIELASGLSASTLRTGSNGDAGSNDIANAVAAVANKSFSTSSGDNISGTLSGFFSSTVSRVGATISNASSALETQQLAETRATTQRDQVSGVSLDEETANLMKYQRAFQASARFVNAIDEMLDTVVNRMGIS